MRKKVTLHKPALSVFLFLLLLAAVIARLYVPDWLSITGQVPEQLKSGINQSQSLSQAETARPEVESVTLAQADFSGDSLPPQLKIQENDRVMGSPTAPVTIIEYASMTCSHCADFHTDTFPRLKENYIDTGKVKFVLRHMPWNNMALGVAALTYCVPRGQYYSLAGALLKSQRDWLRSADPLEEIKKVSRMAGLTDEDVEQCIRDREIQQELQSIKQAGREIGVEGTPAFFINGQQISGAQPYKRFEEVIDAALMQVANAKG